MELGERREAEVGRQQAVGAVKELVLPAVAVAAPTEPTSQVSEAPAG